jgi:hypothetical protein
MGFIYDYPLYYNNERKQKLKFKKVGSEPWTVNRQRLSAVINPTFEPLERMRIIMYIFPFFSSKKIIFVTCSFERQ